MILDNPNHFGRVPIVLDRSNMFLSGQNHFGQVQILKVSTEKSNLSLTKMFWHWIKLFRTVKNNLYQSKTIWMVENHFEPIKGPGIST